MNSLHLPVPWNLSLILLLLSSAVAANQNLGAAEASAQLERLSSSEPEDIRIWPGENAVFAVQVTSDVSLSYQWHKDAAPLSDTGRIFGAQTATLTVALAGEGDVGGYSLTISDGTSSVSSREARLDIRRDGGALDLSFRQATIWGTVHAGVQQPDGKWIIAGKFQTTEGELRGSLARLNLDGSTDHSFMNALAGVEGTVRCIALDDQGRILIGGSFRWVNNQFRATVARLNPDGTIDPTFLASAPGQVRALVIQDDDKILIGGDFSGGILRLNSDGTNDTAFRESSSGTSGWVYTLAIQDDGKIVVGGSFNAVDGVIRNRLARLNGDGTLDTSFGDENLGFNHTVQAVAITDAGKIIAAGSFWAFDGVRQNRIIRLNANGTIDTSFQGGLPGPDNAIMALKLQDDGRILVGGVFTEVDGVSRSRIARLNSNGTLDMNFVDGQLGADAGLNFIGMQRDGLIFIGGEFRGVHGSSRPRVALLHPNGSLDAGFNHGRDGPDGEVRVMTVQADGKLLVAGRFEHIGHIPRNRIARFNADGTHDPSFAVGLVGSGPSVQAVAVQEDGRVLIGGDFNWIDGVAQVGIARLHPDGTLDQSFAGGTPLIHGGSPSTIAIQEDGRVIVAGSFSSVHGINRNNIALLLEDGSVDPSFGDQMTLANSAIRSLAIQPDGKILIGGGFTHVNGVERRNLARLHLNGSLDDEFAPVALGFSGFSPVSIIVLPDGKILIMGGWDRVNGVRQQSIARLHPDGTLDNTFTSPFTGQNSLSSGALQRDGRILMVGSFNFDPNREEPRRGIARLNQDGTLDGSFRNVPALPEFVLTLAIHQDDMVVVGGEFPTINSIPNHRMARLHLGASAPTRISLKSETIFRLSPVGAEVGRIHAFGVDGEEPHTFSLVSGIGDEGNEFFSIADSRLVTAKPIEREQGGSYSLRLRAENTAGIFLEKIFVLTVGTEHPYNVWAASLPPDQRGLLDDPGGYGVYNLLRFAFGMDAGVPDRTYLPIVQRTIVSDEDDPSERLKISFIRRKHSGLIWRVEYSSDLAEWHSLASNELVDTLENEALEAVSAIDPEPTGLSNRRFLRVRVLATATEGL